MDVRARLNALLSPAGSDSRRALYDAVSEGAVAGVARASEHFAAPLLLRDSGPVNFDRGEPLRQALSGARFERRGTERVLVREVRLRAEPDEDVIAEQEYRLPCCGGPEPRLAEARLWSSVAPEAAALDLDVTDFAFLDTETNGLMGGTGTLAFLIGVGRFEREPETRALTFVLTQLFIEDYGHEGAQLRLLEEALAGAKALVTYNGKSFDVPLLRTRTILHRLRSAVLGRPQVDLLTAARRLWKDALGNARLGTVERGVLRIGRALDVADSAEIPEIWHHYARTGHPGRMALVFHHNAQDIASLASLLYRVHDVLRDPAACPARERRGLAKWLEKAGDFEGAAAQMERALEGCGHGDNEDALILEAARLWRKAGRGDKAAELWRALLRRPLAVSWGAWVELAKYQERVEKDAAAALATAEAALRQWELERDVAAMGGRRGCAVPEEAAEELRKRRERLRKRVGRSLK